MPAPFSYFAGQPRPGQDKLLNDPQGGPQVARPKGAPYLACLSLGQPTEPSALAVLEIDARPDPVVEGKLASSTTHYAVVGLKRWEMYTPYQEIGRDLAGIFARPTLTRIPLCVEHTSLGPPIYDVIRKARVPARLFPLVLVNGGALLQEQLPWSVPKRDLIGVLLSLFAERRLHIAHDLALKEVLARELDTFSAKVVAPPEGLVLEVLRQLPNEDLCRAVAIAAWFALRGQRKFRLGV